MSHLAVRYVQTEEKRKMFYGPGELTRSFQVGDWVMRFINPRRRKKDEPVYDGPMMVVEKL